MIDKARLRMIRDQLRQGPLYAEVLAMAELDHSFVKVHLVERMLKRCKADPEFSRAVAAALDALDELQRLERK